MAKKITYHFNKELPIIKPDWKGNIAINGQFHNDSKPEKPPVLDVLKWKLSTNPQKQEKKQDTFQLPSVPLDFLDTGDKIVWLGHATFLITINGVNIITDPCFFDIPTTKRKAVVPCDINVIKNIDYLLLSHDHRDHFDVQSIRKVFTTNPKITTLVPLNMKQLLKRNKLNPATIQEAGWYQSYAITKDIAITFVPAQHWGRRGLFDFNKTLWGGFLLNYNGKKIYFSGDTAYSPVFKEINKTFGAIDICILPIGAYSPKYIMAESHCTPEEAFQIFNDLEGKTFIPMHYGTYDLSDEPLGEPIKRIQKCFENNPSTLKILSLGEKYIL